MRKSIILVVQLLIAVFSCCLPFTVNAKEWRLALCYGEAASDADKSYRTVISETAANIFLAVDKNAQTNVKIRDCVKEPDLTCYGDNEAIFCREEPLAMIVRIAAWLAAESSFIYHAGGGHAAVLAVGPELSWVDALLLADAERKEDKTLFSLRSKQIINKRQLTAKAFGSIYSLVIDLYEHTNNNLAINRNNNLLSTAHQIYTSTTQYAFAFLLGHEAYHFDGNSCPIKSTSRVKSAGFWSEMINLQQKEGLYRSYDLDVHELKADLCGYRWLEMKAKDLNPNTDPVINALSKRIAIDLLAAPILVGMQPDYAIVHPGHKAPKVKVVRGYLYPQSRLILAASTLRLSEDNYPEIVKICNDTGRAMVSIVQDAYQNFPESSGVIPDSMLAEMAPGIEKAWNGSPWAEDSFSCNLKVGK